MVACNHTRPPAAVALPEPSPRDEYVTIIPEVTYSRTGQDAATEVVIDPNEDVMASILAVPRGARDRHGTCTNCPAEAAHDHAVTQLVVAR
jgi:hypothetical protein